MVIPPKVGKDGILGLLVATARRQTLQTGFRRSRPPVTKALILPLRPAATPRPMGIYRLFSLHPQMPEALIPQIREGRRTIQQRAQRLMAQMLPTTLHTGQIEDHQDSTRNR